MKKYLTKLTILIVVSFMCLTSGSGLVVAGAQESTYKLDATGWEVRAFASYGSWTPDKIFDGKSGFEDRWASGAGQSPGQWLIIDMKKKQSFNQITTLCDATDNGYPRGYSIYVSDDNQNWSKAVYSGGGEHGEYTINFKTQTARYIKIELITDSLEETERWWVVREMEVSYDPNAFVSVNDLLPEDIDGQAYKNEIAVLYALGILEGSGTAQYNPDAFMTRAEFVSLILRLFQIPVEDAKEAIFSDVAPDYWAFNDIYTAHKLDIIHGVGGTRFAPDREISYTEVLKIILSLLGYDVKAELVGGYPTGYLSTAKEVSLSNGIDGGTSLTRAQVAKLIYNSLDINFLEKTQFGYGESGVSEKYSSDQDRNLLSIRNIFKGRGIVKGNDVTLLNGNNALPDGRVMIGESQYMTGGSEADLLLGHYVEFFVQQNEGDSTGVLQFAYSMPEKNNSITIKAEDIDKSTTKKQLVYNFDDKKLKSIGLKPDVYLIFNGKAKVIEDSDLTPEAGTIELLDNNNDGEYDVVWVKSFVNYVIASVGSESLSISDKYYHPVLKLKDSSEFKYKIFSDGMSVNLGSLRTGMIASVAADKMKTVAGKTVVDVDSYSYVEIYVSSQSVSGSITEIVEQDGRKYIMIDGVKYQCAPKLYETVPNINVGAEGKFIFDFTGCIAEFIPGETQNSYGILQGVNVKGLDETLYVKIFTERGKSEIYTVADKVKVGLDLKEKSQQVEARLRNYLNQANPQGEATIVMYHVNAAGLLDMISIPSSPDSSNTGSQRDSYTLEKSAPRMADYYYRSETRSLKGEVFIRDDVKIFKIGIDETGAILTDEDTYSVANSTMFRQDKVYDLSCYNFNDAYSPEAICIYDNSSEVVDTEASLLLVDRIIDALSRDGEPVRKLYGIFNGAADFSIEISNSADITGLSRGALIQFVTNQNGQLSSFSYVFDPTTLDTAVARFENGFLSHLQIAFGKVTKMVDDVIIIDISKVSENADYDASKLCYFAKYYNAMTYVFENDNVKVSSPQNIVPGDLILLRGSLTMPKEILIIR